MSMAIGTVLVSLTLQLVLMNGAAFVKPNLASSFLLSKRVQLFHKLSHHPFYLKIANIRVDENE